jgi:TolB-like protein/class 3 adenylate cyclase
MSQTRRLAAILAADVVGYSRLIGADEEGTLNRLRSIRADIIDPKITEHRGRIVKTTGDGLLVEFSSVVDALRCATQWQRGMADRNAGTSDDPIEFRIGINMGDVVVEDGDIFGEGVNVAARLEGQADPGGVCVSARVQEDAAGKLDLTFEDLGEQRLKNIARPVRVYRVRLTTMERTASWFEIAPTLALPDKPSLAVLPFANMSGDPEQEYFVDGMVEEITTAISRLPWLFVIARNSSFAYKGKSPDPWQVGRELGVGYVLEGSVRKSGQRVRITAQLIDTTTGAHVWADRLDGALDDIFELQDQIASSVVGAIEPKLRQSEIERAARKPTERLDAYDLYLQALAHFHRYTEEDVNQVITLLKRALAIDPSYSPAAAMIGWCRAFQRVQGWGPISDEEVAEGVQLARRAIEAGRDNPDTLWMAGQTVAALVGDHPTAASAIDRALVLNPNSAHAWMARGHVSYFQNRPGPAITAFERAMRLSPLDPLGYLFSCGLAFAHTIAGEYEEAMEWADRSLRELPRYRTAINMKVILCAHLGRLDDAHNWLGRLLEIVPGLTIAEFAARLAPILVPEILALYVEGLRKAGLPEE